MTVNGTNELVGRNRVYAAVLGPREPLAVAPKMRVAIVTCMDARIATGRIFGLREGEACQALLESQLIPYKESIRGFIYDVGDGTVHEVFS